MLQAKLVEFVKTLDTVEEKLYHMNKPKYYGWKSYVINAANIQPTSIDFVQYVTNTTVVENELPPIYNLKTSSGKELDVLNGSFHRNSGLIQIYGFCTPSPSPHF